MKKRALLICIIVTMIFAFSLPAAAAETQSNFLSSGAFTPSAGPSLPSLPDELIMSSGAGAWETDLYMINDGSFFGYYSDADYGDSGYGYDYTVYECSFEGKFSNITKLNDTTYSLTLSSLDYYRGIGDYYIEDGVCHVAAEPYGLEVGTQFLFYLPGTPASSLPQGFLNWMPDQGFSTLPYHGLYNVSGEYGFFGNGEVGIWDFFDVYPSSYYHDAVNWAAENGVTCGTSPGWFSPDSNCSRAECVTFLWRAAGEPQPAAAVNPFHDVYSGDYYYKAVLWAAEKGITSGTTPTTFSPSQDCSRSEVVTFLWRAENSPVVTAPTRFSDVPSGSFYEKAVDWAVANSIAYGTGNGNFSPQKVCSRGEIVTFLYRSYGVR